MVRRPQYFKLPLTGIIASVAILVPLIGAPTLAAAPEASDWPQWQGPDRNALSKEKGLLQEWPKEGPPLAWKAKGLGGGYSAPAVAAGKIYGMSKRDGREVVWALNEADGKELWATSIGQAPANAPPQGVEGPGSTPTVDGDRVYGIGNNGDIACLQIADGKVIWQKSLVRDFAGSLPRWSYRESPLVDGDKLICTPGTAEAMMVALNKMTGATIWKSQVAGRAGASYSSAIAIDFEGQRQYVQFVASGVIGVAASDGKFLWRYDKPANGNSVNASTPFYHDGMIFASSAYGAGGGVAKLVKGANGAITAQELWFSRNLQSHHGGVVLFDGRLYGAHGGTEGGNIVCFDFKTGQQIWSEREERRAAKGAIALVDGRIYYRVEDGTMLLIEPDAKQYVERGRFAQPDRTRSSAWAHPVVANGKLYISDQDTLLCYDVKAK